MKEVIEHGWFTALVTGGDRFNFARASMDAIQKVRNEPIEKSRVDSFPRAWQEGASIAVIDCQYFHLRELELLRNLLKQLPGAI